MSVSFDHRNWLWTKTEENSLWKFDRLWTKRWKDVVLFSRNSFQMRKNEKAWWKAIVLLREIELEKLSVLTRRAWCADDCVRGSDESLSWFCWIAMSTLPNNVTTTHWKEKNRASICILVLSFSSATKTGNVIQDTATYRAVCSQRTLERCIIITLCCLKVPRLRKFSLASSFFQKTMQSLFFYNFHIDLVNVSTYCVFALICIFFVLTETAIQINNYTKKCQKSDLNWLNITSKPFTPCFCE